MTFWHGDVFYITGILWGECTSYLVDSYHSTELWCFPDYQSYEAVGQARERVASDLRSQSTHMTSRMKLLLKSGGGLYVFVVYGKVHSILLCANVEINLTITNTIVTVCSIPLTNQGRVMHICVGNLTIIVFFSFGGRQVIMWTNAAILLIGTLGTNLSEVLVEIDAFSFRKMHLNISSAKWRPFCLGLNVLICKCTIHESANAG